MSKEAMKLDVTLEGDEARALYDLLGDDREDLSPVRLVVGDGHSGYGLYAALAEYQDEGAELIASITPPTLQPAQQEPVGCEGAVVNGRVYADRLEHDYKFECEAGPLHLCADWVELRRCFEWMAQHTSPPAQRKPLTDEEIDTLREKHSEGRGAGWRFDFKGFARAIEAKLKEKNT